jgi:hypothetical protein
MRALNVSLDDHKWIIDKVKMAWKIEGSLDQGEILVCQTHEIANNSQSSDKEKRGGREVEHHVSTMNLCEY